MIKVTETELTNKMYEWIKESDFDDLCVLAEHMFGGKFWILDEECVDEYVFEIEPDNNYMGAFGEDNDAK